MKFLGPNRVAFDHEHDRPSSLGHAGRVDAVPQSLLSVLVVDDAPDGDAEIVAHLRAAPPDGVSLGLHSHITPAMLQSDVFCIGYREYPPIDLHETGERVGRRLDVVAGSPLDIINNDQERENEAMEQRT